MTWDSAKRYAEFSVERGVLQYQNFARSNNDAESLAFWEGVEEFLKVSPQTFNSVDSAKNAYQVYRIEQEQLRLEEEQRLADEEAERREAEARAKREEQLAQAEKAATSHEEAPEPGEGDVEAAMAPAPAFSGGTETSAPEPSEPDSEVGPKVDVGETAQATSDDVAKRRERAARFSRPQPRVEQPQPSRPEADVPSVAAVSHYRAPGAPPIDVEMGKMVRPQVPEGLLKAVREVMNAAGAFGSKEPTQSDLVIVAMAFFADVPPTLLTDDQAAAIAALHSSDKGAMSHMARDMRKIANGFAEIKKLAYANLAVSEHALRIRQGLSTKDFPEDDASLTIVDDAGNEVFHRRVLEEADKMQQRDVRRHNAQFRR